MPVPPAVTVELPDADAVALVTVPPLGEPANGAPPNGWLPSTP